MKILVIGSEGFLGRHLMEQGRAMGHSMAGCDVVGKPEFFGIKSMGGYDLDGFDRVIHSAGILGTQETLANVEGAVRCNVLDTLSVLAKCRHASVPMTYLTLGNNWLNPYSITKNFAAEFVRMYNVVHGLDTQVAVCYNAFGPYQKWEPVRKIVPEFMTKMLRGQSIDLFSGGTQMTDMVYAPDLARGILNHMDNGTHHYGSGVARSVRAVASACAEALGIENPVVNMLAPRPGETGPAAIAPYGLTDQTPFEVALKTTAEWYRDALSHP